MRLDSKDPITAGPSILKRPLHHLGYLVPDLRQAIDHWVRDWGAGPFLVIEHVGFDECSSYGGEADLDHSAAFGQWGPLAIELMEVHGVQPSGIAPLLTVQGAVGFHHVAIAVDDAQAERARLEALGMPAYINGRTGPIDISFHDATEQFGCSIEVHKAGPELAGYFASFAAAAQDWDGTDPLRIIEH